MSGPGAPPTAVPAHGTRAIPGSRDARIHDALLVLWLALISADRVDVTGGQGPFVLTPFLLLTPLVLLSELVRVVRRRGRITVPPEAGHYALVAVALLTVVHLSVLRVSGSAELPTSLRRAVHLAVLVGSTYLVAVALLQRRHFQALVRRAVKLMLVLGVVFTVAQVVVFLSGESEPIRLGFATLDLVPFTYAGFIPRGSGLVADPNRAGILYLLALFVLLRWEKPGGARRGWLLLTALLMLLTLSRSVALGAVVLVTVHAFERRPRGLAPATLLGLAAVTAVFVGGWLGLGVEDKVTVGRTLEPLESRFSLSEGSARSHVDLLGRGFGVATRSMGHMGLGIGYGTSFTELQDAFPGNRYGNFHSLYVTMFAEAGIAALLLTLLLLFRPLAGELRSLVAALIFFNIFYQSAAEPVFWLVLALGWLYAAPDPRLGSSAPAPPGRSRPRSASPEPPRLSPTTS